MTARSEIDNYSLRTRLLISFSVLLFVFLGLTGIVLDSAFGNSAEAGAADRLQVQVYLLLAAAEEEDGEFYFLQDLQEPKFGQLNSGLYGFISKPSIGELWRSDSARTLNLADSQLLRRQLEVGESYFTRTENDGETYFMLSYGILWEDGISEYGFSVMENAEPYYSEISNFRTSLWSWLGGVALLLLLMQFFLMRWGLSPLERMANDLQLIEAGQKNQLEADYPIELRGVTKNLNLLIDSERKQQERYRTTLGDLAHSLKTPLAVIAGTLENIGQKSSTADALIINPSLDSAGEQLERMNQIVSYQLQRAVQTQKGSSLARYVNVAAAIERVSDALLKVYADKSVQLSKELDEKLVFRGDERDLVEILGNVLDNAFKYGKGRVLVAVRQVEGSVSGIEISVEDDGPGIPQAQREYVLQRGARADTLVQGQGIGLAVVTDIIASYEGEIKVSGSDLGGARIVIVLAAGEA